MAKVMKGAMDVIPRGGGGENVLEKQNDSNSRQDAWKLTQENQLVGNLRNPAKKTVF
jgi:hypothetical protein